MVRAKLSVYYTFRVMEESPLKVECKKWEEGADVPMETYVVHPGDACVVSGCSCPAWTNQCKHRRCVDEARRDGKINELYHWKWDEKGGWTRVDDINSIEDMPEIG